MLQVTHIKQTCNQESELPVFSITEMDNPNLKKTLTTKMKWSFASDLYHWLGT